VSSFVSGTSIGFDVIRDREFEGWVEPVDM